MADQDASPASRPRPRRGAFIVLEGMDRAGKTTQAARLLAQLRDTSSGPVELMKFPDRTTPIGRMIDAYLASTTELDDRAIHLLFSANRWENASRIEDALNAGTTIICDRYAYSGVAFSAAKPSLSHSPRSIESAIEWCAAPDKGLPAPDTIVFLDVAPDVAAKRGGYGEERYERAEVQRAVRTVFARLGGFNVDGAAGKPKWRVVDAAGTPDEVAYAVWATITDAGLCDGTQEPLGRLWDS